jgi:flagellar motility protein MotE (MotC chaperone)
MIRILQSPWVSALVGSLLYLGTTLLLISPEPFQGAVAAQESEQSALTSPSWSFRNPEFEQWISEIKREKEALDAREQQLNELQTRLEAERQEISVVTESVQQVQAEFDRNVVRFKDQEMENLRRQAKLVGSMPPESAAALIQEMPDEDAVRLLFTMKNDQASLIIDTVTRMGQSGVRRAAALTEKLRRVLPPDPAAKKTTPSS